MDAKPVHTGNKMIAPKQNNITRIKGGNCDLGPALVAVPASPSAHIYWQCSGLQWAQILGN